MSYGARTFLPPRSYSGRYGSPKKVTAGDRPVHSNPTHL